MKLSIQQERPTIKVPLTPSLNLDLNSFFVLTEVANVLRGTYYMAWMN